ncbi:hypothetical protein [Stetteria hydrogenophila]
MKAIIPLTRDPVSLLAAESSGARLFEEYSVDSYLILASKPIRRDDVDALTGFLGNLVGRGNVKARWVDTSPERLAGEEAGALVSGILRVIDEESAGEPLVAAVSPASRILAAALSVACAQRQCTVAHTHFYFGPWRGLPYPYTPRRLEPLIIIAGESRPGGEAGNAARRAVKLYWDEGVGCPRIPGVGPLPPLRCAVAETARRLNDVTGARVVVPGRLGPCGRLAVTEAGSSVAEAELCDERSVARAAEKIAGLLGEVAEGLEGPGAQVKSPLIQSLAWAGLATLKVHSSDSSVSGAPLPEAPVELGLVADTNLIYYGIHVYAWEGVPVKVPECAEIEVEKAWSEALKHGRLETARDAAALLAYLALLDLKGAGSHVLPTLPVACDVAVAKADPLALEGYSPATADDGAFRYWSRHPRLRGARVFKVSFDPNVRAARLIDELESPERLSRLYYALVQSLVILELFNSQGITGKALGGRVEFTLKTPDGEEKRFKPAAQIIEKALGLKARAG